MNLNLGSIDLGLRENRIAFRPGDEIAGAARWELGRVPKQAEVRLCWYTRGKGTKDVEIVEAIPFEDPKEGDVRTFSFRAPNQPYSFSGKLISIIWFVELVIEPGDRFPKVDITIGPEAKEVVLLGS